MLKCLLNICVFICSRKDGERRRRVCWFVLPKEMVCEHVFALLQWSTTCILQPANKTIFVCSFYSSASNRIIHAKDHASVQLSIVDVDPETGRMTVGSKTYAICGEIRRMGESDDCIVRLAKKDGLITKWVCWSV